MQFMRAVRIEEVINIRCKVLTETCTLILLTVEAEIVGFFGGRHASVNRCRTAMGNHPAYQKHIADASS